MLETGRERPRELCSDSTRLGDLVHLFEYVRAFEKVIGEDKAWEILSDTVAARRLAWLHGNMGEESSKESDVERGYRLFILSYLGLKAEEAPIVEKTSKRIVFRSRNFCPVLETCKLLGFDTREICRKVYERPTQAFMAAINPRLRFRRNYEMIRPYADFCEEIIELDE